MNCEEAINFYVSVFPHSKINSIMRYPTDMQVGPVEHMGGKILTAFFHLDGFNFQALDGGPFFQLNPSISFMVNFDPSREADAQDRLEQVWEKLSQGGVVRMPLQEYPFSKRYGWIQDRFGVNWQLILTDPEGEPRPPIMPSIMFGKGMSGKATEAAQFYIATFKDSTMGIVAPYPPGMPHGVAGGVMFEDFMLAGQWFTAMDAGPEHDFQCNEALSLSIECADQAEVDYFWNELSAHPENEQCGWVKDRFGVSWQIVPKRMIEMMANMDSEQSKRVLAAMLEMKKLDIRTLEDAFEGK